MDIDRCQQAIARLYLTCLPIFSFPDSPGNYSGPQLPTGGPYIQDASAQNGAIGYGVHNLVDYSRRQYQQQLQQQQQMPVITRSVSNLTRMPVNHSYSTQADGMCGVNSNIELNSIAHQVAEDAMSFSSDYYYRPQQYAANALPEDSNRVNRKRRSKSRDLGSLLMEAAHLRAVNSMQQQQCPLYDNEPQLGSSSALASNHLVRSQTDCSHLMGRYVQSSDLSLGMVEGRRAGAVAAAKVIPQQQPYCSATLDRRMINRRYHVYEHEFYPPRLLPQGSAGGVQAVVGAPQNPFAHRSSSGNQAEASIQTRSGAAIAVVPPLARSGEAPDAASDSFSTSSLSSNQLMTMVAANGSERQPAQHKQSIDRFVARQHSRKQPAGDHEAPAKFVPDDGEPNSTRPPEGDARRSQETHMDNCDNRHRDLDGDGEGSSRRLSSNETYLFESTQQALMRDFDLMIGKELLNGRSDRKPLGSRLPAACNSSSAGAIKSNLSHHQQQQLQQRPTSTSQSTILTGVSLDMDHYGERLTVSGTLTLPIEDDDGCSRARQQQQRQYIHEQHNDSNSSLRQAVSIDNAKQVSSIHPVAAANPNPTPTATSCQLDVAPAQVRSSSAKPKPEKPPRPSLESSTKFQQMRSNRQQQQSSLDQRSNISLNASNVIYDQPAVGNNKRTADNGRQKQQTDMTSYNKSTVASGRPVPTPVVVTNPSNTTKTASAHRTSVTQPPKERPPPPPLPPVAVPQRITVATRDQCIPDTVPSNKSIADEIDATCNSAQLSQHLATASLSSGADVDSGVCTSNSPASLSHHSDDVINPSVIKTDHRDQMPSSRSAISSDLSRPVRMELCARNATEVPPIAPPSPTTAQSCIEDALKPLEQVSRRI